MSEAHEIYSVGELVEYNWRALTDKKPRKLGIVLSQETRGGLEPLWYRIKWITGEGVDIAEYTRMHPQAQIRRASVKVG
jgi:hypothetical protein